MRPIRSLYVIGSLRNPAIPDIADTLRMRLGLDVFDDWFAAGPRADDHWQAYEQGRQRSLVEALDGHSANHVFGYDKSHLDCRDAAVLVMPAGKSGHLELGYFIGRGKPGFVLFTGGEPERWDVMYRFASGVFTSLDGFAAHLETLINGSPKRLAGGS